MPSVAACSVAVVTVSCPQALALCYPEPLPPPPLPPLPPEEPELPPKPPFADEEEEEEMLLREELLKSLASKRAVRPEVPATVPEGRGFLLSVSRRRCCRGHFDASEPFSSLNRKHSQIWLLMAICTAGFLFY